MPRDVSRHIIDSLKRGNRCIRLRALTLLFSASGGRHQTNSEGKFPRRRRACRAFGLAKVGILSAQKIEWVRPGVACTSLRCAPTMLGTSTWMKVQLRSGWGE